MKPCVRWLVVVLTAAMLCGCSPAIEEKSDQSVVAQADRDYIILVMFDMSGSYAKMMAEDGKAWWVLQQIMDRYFRGRLGGGTNDRILVGQLSGSKPVLLFEGTPLQLRQAYPSAKEFRQTLTAASNPGSSRIYDGIRDGVTYLSNYPGVTDGRTKTAVFLATDMEDNASEPQAINFLLGTLSSYAKQNGSIALLFVSQRECGLWQRELPACGFRPGRYVVYSEIVHQPDLPDFSEQ